MTSNWWENYFGDEWQSILRQVKTPTTTLEEANFLNEILYANECQRILDVPSGEGRISLALAQKGYDVTGLEFNANAVAHAQQLAEAQNLTDKVTFVVGDMRQLPYKEAFDAALCLFNSFGYFTDEENEQFIATVSQSLKANGVLVMDMHVLESLLPVYTPQEYWRYEDYLVLEERSIDLPTSRLNGTWSVIKDGKEKKYHSSVRVYSYKELTELLTTYGFENFTPFANYYGDPFTIGDDGMVLVCNKRGALRIEN